MAAETTLLVRGRWRCESRIASLTTNTIWRARDELLDRPVAIRIFHPELLVDPSARERLEQAFSVAARLEHDNISCVFDAFDDDLGVVLVSELVEGPTLRQVIDQLAPSPSEGVAAIGVQLASGAAAASTSGLAHRELTPSHVRITHDGTVKILGLGSARLLSDETATPLAGQEIDPAYLAPEQFDEGRSDQRTDIYCIGLMLWELATGARPFEADVEARRRQDLPPVHLVEPGIAARVSDAISKATRSDPKERWEDAGELAASLLPECSARPKRIVYELARSILSDPPAPIATLRSASATSDSVTADSVTADTLTADSATSDSATSDSATAENGTVEEGTAEDGTVEDGTAGSGIGSATHDDRHQSLTQASLR